MTVGCDRPLWTDGRVLLVAAALLAAAGPTTGQQQGPQSRERAQLMQMQQQLQRLQQDSVELQGKLRKKDEDLQKQSEAEGTVKRQLSAARADATARSKELESARAELEHTKESLAAALSEIAQLKSVVARRDDALTKSIERAGRDEQAQSLLGERLKHQTARSDRCETKHAAAMTYAGQIIDLYERDRLRLCEPITGLWKPRSQNLIQDLRSHLSAYQLEAPVEASHEAAARQ